ncbi:MAG: aspartyl/glutamyl-tRNA amidotransferase subunit A, partial [Firmicutes bacterium]|nr:aspartyl/glutamyl-tRNA amidotransferase subunit A [Bacillota bacterium]
DEFAMGGSNENSAFGACKNALDDSCVSGGSSGGSAVAVALDMCSAALGSDTGGSVRQPSSFNGVVGTKPTYGRVSRYGIVAFASSLDQVGPITKTVQDNAYLLNILAGHDENDQTTLSDSVDDYLVGIKNAISGMKIAYCKELLELYKKSNYYDNFVKLVEFLKSNGATVEEVSVPNIDLALPVYYIIAPAEATSNLTRFDGIKYTTRSEDSLDLNSLYVNSRTEGFGDEVKRRIMIGNYVLSSGFYDAYYVKAKKIQKYIVKMFNELFAKYDAMIMPVTYGEAFKIGSKNNDPVTMYLEDIFTVIANISSIPAISVPYSKGENNLPLGIQVLSKRLNEKTIFQIANLIESDFGGLGNE